MIKWIVHTYDYSCRTQTANKSSGGVYLRDLRWNLDVWDWNRPVLTWTDGPTGLPPYLQNYILINLSQLLLHVSLQANVLNGEHHKCSYCFYFSMIVLAKVIWGKKIICVNILCSGTTACNAVMLRCHIQNICLIQIRVGLVLPWVTLLVLLVQTCQVFLVQLLFRSVCFRATGSLGVSPHDLQLVCK